MDQISKGRALDALSIGHHDDIEGQSKGHWRECIGREWMDSIGRQKRGQGDYKLSETDGRTELDKLVGHRQVYTHLHESYHRVFDHSTYSLYTLSSALLIVLPPMFS